MTNYPVLTRLGVSLIDTLVTILSFVLAGYIRNAFLSIYEFGTVASWFSYPIILIMIILIWRGLFGYQEAYLSQRFTSLKSEILIVIKTVLFGSLIVLTIAFMIKSKVPRSLIALFAVVNLGLLSLWKIVLHQFIKYVRKQGENIKKVLVLGAGDVAKTFIDSVEKNSDWGVRILGLVCKDEVNVKDLRFGYRLLGHTADLRELLHYNPIDELVIALPAKYLHAVEDAMTICDEEGVPVRIISPFFRNLISQAKADMIHGLPIIKFSSVERNDFEAALKRSIDIVVSFILLILLAPVFGLIALFIVLDSKGPVFYKWKVLGLNKRPLTSYKFRTMVENADDLKAVIEANNEMNGIAFKMKADPRITKVGKFLRKFSLDELPQFWSVLKGDLSLVGPRPPLQTEVEKYEAWHRRKLSVKPGITCLWQVSGRNEISDFDEWMRLDMKYIDQWSLWLDFKILFKTPLAVLKGTGR
jgi:exopolysaccharide biosynthesis polyprenyl glycosylphosphotransferase